MRLKSVVWAKAYIRRCAVSGAQAFVVRHGDDDAGAIFVKVSQLDGHAKLYGPAPMSLDDEDAERKWVLALATRETPDIESEVDLYLRSQFEFDNDIWVIEVEDPAGRHFFDGEEMKQT